METQLIAVTLQDGKLAIMTFVLRAPGSPYRSGTDEEIADEIAQSGLNAKSWRRITAADLPTDRTERDTWIDTGTAIASSAPPPDGAAVDAERDRRIALGFTVTMSDNSSFPVQTRDETDFRNITGLSTAALALLGQGSTATMVFRDAVNVNHTLTLADVISLGLQVAAGMEAIYTKSWALKALTTIPIDYADDKFWT